MNQITLDHYQELITELADQLGIPIQDAKALLDGELSLRGFELLPEL